MILIFAILLAIIFGVLNIFSLINLSLAITLVAAEVPVGLILHWITKSKHNAITSETNRESISKNRYCDHLKVDFSSVINPNADNLNENYFKIIYTLPDDQRDIIKQHMFTYEKHPQTPLPLFKYYTLMTEAKRSLPINRSILLREIRIIASELANTSRSYTDFDFDRERFENSLTMSLKSFSDLRMEKLHETEFENELHLNMHNNSWISRQWGSPNIKNNGIIIAESKSQEILDEIYDEIRPNIIKFNRCMNKIWTAKHNMEYWNKKMDKIIKEIITMTRKGTPTIGICNICKDFTYIEKEKNNLLKKLDKYNSNEEIRNEFEWQDDNYFKYKDIR